MDDRAWAESVEKVREIDETLADELAEHYLRAGYAYSRLIVKILDKKESN